MKNRIIVSVFFFMSFNICPFLSINFHWRQPYCSDSNSFFFTKSMADKIFTQSIQWSSLETVQQIILNILTSIMLCASPYIFSEWKNHFSYSWISSRYEKIPNNIVFRRFEACLCLSQYAWWLYSRRK